jgi:hypothetical protein
VSTVWGSRTRSVNDQAQEARVEGIRKGKLGLGGGRHDGHRFLHTHLISFDNTRCLLYAGPKDSKLIKVTADLERAKGFEAVFHFQSFIALKLDLRQGYLSP